MRKVIFSYLLISIMLLLAGCGFHLQGQTQLAPPLKRMYLQMPDPYSYLARYLRDNLKMSNVQLVSSPNEADTILIITQDVASQDYASVSGTQQTRQNNLHVTVTFEVANNKGITLVPAQTITETRTITVQSNQILGTTNEVNLLYQQMRRTLAYAMMNRLASREITRMVMNENHIH